MTYPGGKNGAGTYQKLINLMPPHDVYIEAFLGSGAVMRLKRPARLNIGLDLVESQVLTVAAEISANGLCVETMPTSSSLLAATAGPLRTSGDGIRYRLMWGCAIAFLELVAPKLTMEALLYCDPPYLLSTLSSAGRYEHMLSDVDHRRLLRVLRKLPCMVMLSGYWSQMYADALPDWNTLQFKSMTRGGLATETVWYNFPTPVALHDYRYLGVGFRERERIKRKKQRWVNRLGRMPVLERQALLAALETVSPDPDSSD